MQLHTTCCTDPTCLHVGSLFTGEQTDGRSTGDSIILQGQRFHVSQQPDV